MKYFSMFSGIGGFELGIKQAITIINSKNQLCNRQQLLERDHDRRILQEEKKATCVGYSEIDKYAIQIYEKHFRGHKNYGDATTIIPETIPDFDLLVGGFPCQAFSIAGKRRGFEDTRGTLFFDIARIIKVKQPRLFVLENVKGLLNHNKGETFTTILQTIDELGYDVQWEVLNSKHFGVPQNRERVFIIGHLRGTSRPEIFPIRGTNLKDIKQLNNPIHSNNRLYSKEGISPCINTAQGGNRQPFIKAVLTPNRIEKRQNGRRIKEDGEPSFTLTGQDIHGILKDSRIRRLTPTECERLQGFPDGWTEGLSDTQRYKTLGNAVTVNVIEAIFNRLLLINQIGTTQRGDSQEDDEE